MSGGVYSRTGRITPPPHLPDVAPPHLFDVAPGSVSLSVLHPGELSSVVDHREIQDERYENRRQRDRHRKRQTGLHECDRALECDR